MMRVLLVAIPASAGWFNRTSVKKREFRRRVHKSFFESAASLASPLLGLVDGAVEFIEDVPVIGDALGSFVDDSQSLNKLAEFGAQYDFLLNSIMSTSVQGVALTSANVSNGDCKDRLEKAFEWPHGLFPGVRTKGYDCTLQDDDLMFLLDNKAMNSVFQTGALKSVIDDLWTKIDYPKLEDQGAWVDGVPSQVHANNVYMTSSDLGDRYDKALEMMRAPNQASIELRELVYWSPTDDLEFAKFYFAGTASPLLQRASGGRSEGAAFVAPLDYLSQFAVKEGAGKYGGDVFFDDKGTPTHIYYDSVRYVPTDAKWDAIKKRCRGSVVMYLTLIHHLLGLHLSFANALAHAAPMIPPTHPVRQLVWPHIFNTIGVNRKAAVALSNPDGLFARAWALTGVVELYEYEVENNPLFKWMTPTQRFDAQNMDFLPFQQDGRLFYGVVRDYVKEYVDHYYKSNAAVEADAELQLFGSVLNNYTIGGAPALVTKKALVDAISTYIFYITGYHTQVGSIHHDATRPDVAPASWFEDGDDAMPNSYFYTLSIFYLTADLRLPLIGDTCATEHKCGFANKTDFQSPKPRDAVTQPPITPRGYPDIFQDQSAKDINARFMASLLDMQQVITERNRARFQCVDNDDTCTIPAVCRVFNSFDLNYIESSIGI